MIEEQVGLHIIYNRLNQVDNKIKQYRILLF